MKPSVVRFYDTMISEFTSLSVAFIVTNNRQKRKKKPGERAPDDDS